MIVIKPHKKKNGIPWKRKAWTSTFNRWNHQRRLRSELHHAKHGRPVAVNSDSTNVWPLALDMLSRKRISKRKIDASIDAWSAFDALFHDRSHRRWQPPVSIKQRHSRKIRNTLPCWDKNAASITANHGRYRVFSSTKVVFIRSREMYLWFYSQYPLRISTSSPQVHFTREISIKIFSFIDKMLVEVIPSTKCLDKVSPENRFSSR